MESVLINYYSDNARKLRRMVDSILLKFGGLSDKDMDDFYSLANEVFADVIKRYDSSQSFDKFLYSCLDNRIKSEMTKRNRYKRRAEQLCISLDAPVGEDENITLVDILEDNFDIEREVWGDKEDEYSDRMAAYLSRLSRLQRDVLKLTATGYKPGEIRRELHISEKEYTDCNMAIHSYRNVSLLF